MSIQPEACDTVKTERVCNCLLPLCFAFPKMENVKCGRARLSRFFGIIIRMYRKPGSGAARRIFHAYDQEHASIFSIEAIEMARGMLLKTAAPTRRSLG